MDVNQDTTPEAEATEPTPTPDEAGGAGDPTPEQPTETAEPSALDALHGALDDLDDLDEWEPDAPEKAPAAEAEEPADPPEADPKAQKPEEAEEPDPEEPKAEDKSERAYSVVGEDGSEVDFELPEGAKVRFKGDGAQRTMTMDELVTNAQKGVYMDRRLGEFTTKEKDFTRQLGEVRSEVKEAERILREVVNNPEARKKVAEALRKYDDPNAKEAREAREEADRLKAEKTKDAETRRAQATEKFWGSVQERVAANVGDGNRFPLLVADDAEDVLGTYWDRYQEHTYSLLDRYVSEGMEQAQAEEKAAADGLAWLTEENLYGVMEDLNGKYARRLRPGTQQAPAQRESEEDAEEAEVARAEQHNKRVERKLAQRDTRTLRGPAAPARTPAAGAGAGGDWQGAIEKEWERMGA